MLKPLEEWWKPSTEVPEGSFALFRADGEYIELLTDMCATRTIWYLKTDAFFIASSSQRAIVHFLQDFQPNLHAQVWMISSGCLGPGYSWDQRIEALKPDSTLTLHRASWNLEITTNPAIFQTKKHDWKSAKETLSKELHRVFESLDLDFSKWALPLSGGHDSRAILYFLRDKKEMRCITWGVSESLNKSLTDAQIAKTLADHFHFRHIYLPTDIGLENVSANLDRSVYACEGRCEHIGAYADGLKMWRNMFRDGIEGIIRGDEAFGVFFVSSELEANYRASLTTYEHFRNLHDLVEKTWVTAKQQVIPDWLLRRANESPATWRDRVYQTHRVPNYLCGSYGRKCSYVEVINPYLSRGIVRFVRTLPDEFRTKSDKSLFNEIVNELIPDIPVSKFDSLTEIETLLRNDKVAAHIANTLIENKSSGYFPESFIESVLAKLSQNKPVEARTSSIKDFARKVMPQKIKDVLRNKYKRNLDYYRLAFRVFIAIRAHQMFRDDAKAFSN
jgi:asparagine synthetase B (glutamine-hydrolysing)